MGRTVRLSLVQMRDAGTPAGCIESAVTWIEKAASEGAQVILLQELIAGPYPCQSEDHRNFDYAETIPGPSTDAISAVAKRLEVVVVVPLFERRAPGLYHNTVAVIDADGSIAGLYRKMHIPDDPLFYEKFYFTPGDIGFKPIETRYAKLGVGINGSLKQRGCLPSQELRSFFIRQRLAGLMRRRRSLALDSKMRG